MKFFASPLLAATLAAPFAHADICEIAAPPALSPELDGADVTLAITHPESTPYCEPTGCRVYRDGAPVGELIPPEQTTYRELAPAESASYQLRCEGVERPRWETPLSTAAPFVPPVAEQPEPVAVAEVMAPVSPVSVIEDAEDGTRAWTQYASSGEGRLIAEMNDQFGSRVLRFDGAGTQDRWRREIGAAGTVISLRHLAAPGAAFDILARVETGGEVETVRYTTDASVKADRRSTLVVHLPGGRIATDTPTILMLDVGADISGRRPGVSLSRITILSVWADELMLDDIALSGGDEEAGERAVLGSAGAAAAASTGGVSGELLAFPGAVGAARKASGGRGGRVVIVDTLSNRVDPGDGRTSLREALEVVSGPRTIVFDVGGVFDTGSELVVMAGSAGSDVTVACQTAPSPGVVIKGLGIRITNGAHNLIMRHCTIRNIDPGRPASESSRPITVAATKAPVSDMIFDHLSASWATDENWTVFMGPSARADSARFTLSNSIIAEGDADSSHAESGQLPRRYLHAMGPSCNSASTTYRINDCSIISNLIAHNGRRNPLMWGVSGELIDNRIYNWHETALDARPWKNGRLEMNVIGNEFKAGPTSKKGNNPFKLFGSAPQTDARVRGNTLVAYPGGKRTPISDRVVGRPPGASAAAGFDAACVGASRPARDEVDTRIVHEYQSGTGQVGIFGDHRRDYSMYRSSSRPAGFDIDRDGIADAWERANGLDAAIDNSRTDLDGDGYTDLEEYINYMARCE